MFTKSLVAAGAAVGLVLTASPATADTNGLYGSADPTFDVMNPPAPITGGMNMPPMDAAGSMPPAMWALNPALFIMGMVKVPVETVLAMALPEMDPKSPLAMTETLAGPPTLPPTAARGNR